MRTTCHEVCPCQVWSRTACWSLHISGRTFVTAHDGISSISQHTAYARRRVIRWCPSKYSAHPQQVSATPARSIWAGYMLRGSALRFWVDFAAFLSVSGRGSYTNGLGRLSEYAKVPVCDFSTLAGYPTFVAVKFGDQRLAGCCE